MCGQESTSNWPMRLSVNASRMVGRYTLSSNMVIVLCTHSVEIRVFHMCASVSRPRWPRLTESWLVLGMKEFGLIPHRSTHWPLVVMFARILPANTADCAGFAVAADA